MPLAANRYDGTPGHGMVTAALALALAATTLSGQVELEREAVVYFGSAANASAPATIDHLAVGAATPEGRTIRVEGVRPGSARHRLLTAAMQQRIRRAVRMAVAEVGRDLVVRRGDIRDSRGGTVADLTARVIGHL